MIGAAVAVAAGAWVVGVGRGSAVAAVEREAKARAEAARTAHASAGMFRATVCAASPCVLVEAGGLAFLFGAGRGAAEGLASLGLMRADLDGVLLADIGLSSVEGLPALRTASLAAGRAEPLPVFGPEGVFPAVDGANLMLTGSTSDSARLTVGGQGEDQGLAGKVVFDSGVVTVRAFAADEASRVYRVDFGGKSLVIAGCLAKPADLMTAVRGAKQASAIVAAYSSRLGEIEGLKADRACMAVADAVSAVEEAKLSGGILWPLVPTPDDSLMRQAWGELATIPKGLNLALGEPGLVLDLTNEKPVIHAAR
jgi:hypothetical protein